VTKKIRKSRRENMLNEKEIEECGKQYQQIAKDFMNSYGLEDYLLISQKIIDDC